MVYGYEKAFKSIWSEDGEKQVLVVNEENRSFIATNEYNQTNALILIDGVIRIEKVTSDIEEPADPVGFTKEASYITRNAPTFAVLWSKGDDLMIALRATHGSWEVQQDLDISQVIFQESNMHQGFVNVYNEFRDELIDKVKELNPARIFVGGHSLGGALVPMICVDLEQYNVTVYSFGAPRSSDDTFKTRTSNLSIYRIANESDDFTHLPTTVSPNVKHPDTPLKYTHVGTEIKFDVNKGYVQSNHSINTYLDFVEQ